MGCSNPVARTTFRIGGLADLDKDNVGKELAEKGVERFDGSNGRIPQDVMDQALMQAQANASSPTV